MGPLCLQPALDIARHALPISFLLLLVFCLYSDCLYSEAESPKLPGVTLPGDAVCTARNLLLPARRRHRADRADGASAARQGVQGEAGARSAGRSSSAP